VAPAGVTGATRHFPAYDRKYCRDATASQKLQIAASILDTENATER